MAVPRAYVQERACKGLSMSDKTSRVDSLAEAVSIASAAAEEIPFPDKVLLNRATFRFSKI
ncbi:hypothetical protein DXM21_23225 [Agrobacterium rosae]|nr:hypothetical protein DXM21_23225 [Agrobacterium rosae]KAA3513480.1 hypothetical protein DXM25_23420 [Agrobacterium rosae]MQB51037.1 hypothetical protein [Agrobacterium rosae]